MAGPDGRDFVSLQDDPGDYLVDLDAGVDGMRFAWTDDFGYADMYVLEESPRVIEHVRLAAATLGGLGATVETTDEVWEDFWPSYLTTSQTFVEIVMPFDMPKPSAEAFESALAVRQRNWQRFRDVLTHHDLLLSPTSQLIAVNGRGLEHRLDPTELGVATRDVRTALHEPHPHVQLARWPAVSVPCGFVDGLPVGLQIIGKPGGEAMILRVANVFQSSQPSTPHPPVA